MEYNQNGAERQFPGHLLDNEKWGYIVHIQEECPGVFYLSTRMETYSGRELYAVTEEAVPSIISKETLYYGKKENGIYLFAHEVEGSGRELVQYEILRYRVKNHIAMQGDSLYSLATDISERYPEYFGGTLPPRYTPWGLTTRVKKIAEGLFFLETDQCQWILGAAPFVWDCDLSPYAQALGTFCKLEKQCPAESRYLFFDIKNCILPIYELLKTSRYSKLTNYICSQEVLENLLLFQHPEYVIGYNLIQISGHGQADLLTNLLSLFGGEILEEGESEEQGAKRIASCIHYWPSAGQAKLLMLPE